MHGERLETSKRKCLGKENERKIVKKSSEMREQIGCGRKKSLLLENLNSALPCQR